ncbi:hypothetical protein GCM10023339_78210 [Alloalcanivorax gelatiniphagus]
MLVEGGKDFELMVAIKNNLNNLSSRFNDVVNLGIYKSKTANKSDMIN